MFYGSRNTHIHKVVAQLKKRRALVLLLPGISPQGD